METGLTLAILLLTIIALLTWSRRGRSNSSQRTRSNQTIKADEVPTSVNYHITRRCNYKCGFCFHTAKSNDVLKVEEASHGLKLLAQAGMRKINFAGGEPFLMPKFLGQLVMYCKEELRLESVSIVSNASKIKETWFQKYGRYVDILAVSVDSFDEQVNVKIGRGAGDHLKQVKVAQELCSKYKIKFKINTVVNRYNWQEDMNKQIAELSPVRWKVFKVLVLKGENDGNNTLRDAREFEITEPEFAKFLEGHSKQSCLVPENNDAMKNSYLVLDEQMRFLDSSDGGKVPSQSILEVGVAAAMAKSGYDPQKFVNRGGIYEWTRQMSKDDSGGCQSECIDW